MSSIVQIARHLDFVREVGGPNTGDWVTFIQRVTGNGPGDSWCASFVCLVLDIAYRGKSPLKATAWTPAVLAEAKRNGWITITPQPGDLFFYVNAERAHHVGIVTGIDPLIGIAGNTSPDGLSNNGTGVFEHAISATNTVFVHLPQP